MQGRWQEAITESQSTTPPRQSTCLYFPSPLTALTLQNTQFLLCDKHAVSFFFFFLSLAEWLRGDWVLSVQKPTCSLNITGQVSDSLRPSLTALLGLNYPQIHHVLNAVPRSALLVWRKAISHQEIINQRAFWPTSYKWRCLSPPAASCLCVCTVQVSDGFIAVRLYFHLACTPEARRVCVCVCYVRW